MIIKLSALAILVEALVELFFKAAPLQGIRLWLIKKTPWLRSEAQGHLLDCKYCTSVWVAVLAILAATFADFQVTRLAAAVFIVGRLSNYAHSMICTIRDFQINLRLERK